MPSESYIEAESCRLLMQTGCECVKVGQHGYPDRLVIFPDRESFFWVEFKTDKGRIRTAQKTRIRNLKRKGDLVRIVRSVEETKELIREDWFKHNLE